MPCRRSRVRIPSAASEKARICRLFSRAQSACASASGRTDSGPRADRRPFQGNALFAGRFWFVRTEVLLRACRTSGVLPAGGVRTTLAATARSSGQRLPGRYQRSRSLGPVRFQSGNREVNLAPLRARRAMAPRAVSFRRRTACRGSGAVPITGGLCRGSHTGHRRRCRFPSPSRRLCAPGLCCWLSSTAGADRVSARVSSSRTSSSPACSTGSCTSPPA